MIGYGNHISKWIGRELSRCENQNQKSILCRYFVDLMEEFTKLENYNGTWIALAGFSSQPIGSASVTCLTSLSLSFVNVECLDAEYRKKIQKFELLFSPKTNMKGYREAIGRLPLHIPCIPCISVILSDFLSLFDSLPDVVDGGLIYFRKYRQLSLFVDDVMALQRNYNYLEPVISIQKWIYEVIRDQVIWLIYFVDLEKMENFS